MLCTHNFITQYFFSFEHKYQTSQKRHTHITAVTAAHLSRLSCVVVAPAEHWSRTSWALRPPTTSTRPARGPRCRPRPPPRWPPCETPGARTRTANAATPATGRQRRGGKGRGEKEGGKTGIYGVGCKSSGAKQRYVHLHMVPQQSNNSSARSRERAREEEV